MRRVGLKRPPYQEWAIHDDSCVAEAPLVDGVAKGVSGVKYKEVVVAEVRWQATQPASNEFIVKRNQFLSRWKGSGYQAVVYPHCFEMVCRLGADVGVDRGLSNFSWKRL